MLLSWSVCRRTAAEQPRRRRLRGGNVPFHDQQKSSTHWIRTWRRCYVSTPSWCRWSGVRRRHRGHQSTSDRRRRSPSSRPNHYSRHHTQVSCTLISGQVERSVGYVCLSVCVCVFPDNNFRRKWSLTSLFGTTVRNVAMKVKLEGNG